MADFIVFDEGADELNDNGFPATTYFLLSDKSVDGTNPFAEADSLGTGDGEITGTSYARQSQVTPASSSRDVAFTQESWATGVNTDWSATVRSVVACTTNDDAGVMLCAWNLQAGGAARDMSAANTTENVTPTYSLNSPA